MIALLLGAPTASACRSRSVAPGTAPLLLWYWAASCWIALCGSGCGKAPPTETGIATPAARTKVEVVELAAQEIVDFDEFVGRTEASATVEVRARVSGYVKDVHFADGDRVEVDQLLFTIEPDAYQAIHQQSLSRIDLWQAKKELAESKRARAQRLIEANAMSREEYDENVAATKEADAQITAARADADRSALDLKYTEVRSQIAGRIDRAMVTPGNMVSGGLGSGTLLTRIVQNQPMHAFFDVDERTILRYQRLAAERRQDAEVRPQSVRELNVRCEMQLADESGFPHVGQMDFIENRVDAATGTIRARGVFANEDNTLTGGLFVRVRIPVSDPYQAILVPEQSLGVDQTQRFVYVVTRSNVVERRVVTPGRQRGPLRVILSGLQAGERIVYRGLPRIRPEQEVDTELVPMPQDPSQTP